MASLNDIISLQITGYSVPDEGDDGGSSPPPGVQGNVQVNTASGNVQVNTSTGVLQDEL